MTPQSMRHQDALELIPPAFLELVRTYPADPEVRGPSGADWAAALPRLVAALVGEWGLEPTDEPLSGQTSVVVPVQRGHQRLVLKVVWPHVEARDEALALRHWDGHGSVRLVAAEPSRGALLLERLDHTADLHGLDVDAACEVAGELLSGLNVPAPPGLRRLSDYVQAQLATVADATGSLPRRMVDRATGLARDLRADPECDARIVHTDLHYGNVLAGGREPWLAIDPKPMAGHPGFEVQPLLRNRVEELGTGSTFRYLVRRRVEIVSEAAGIDEDLALAWSYVHTTLQASWAVRGGDSEGVSFNVALLKALDG